ncbi:MAG: 30S ribosome-binding factor RbfA [Deltaproteobacteria bacterium]|nr:30S ribosome-binding factor RbfA [Deltaproteobacteria bacterium]
MLPKSRAIRVGDLVLRELADLVMKKLKDPRVKGITLTAVDVSKDLRHARVYFSLIGDNAQVIQALAGLDSAKGFLKREIGLRVNLRHVPDLVFRHDPSLERGSRMEKLLQKLKEDVFTVPGE